MADLERRLAQVEDKKPETKSDPVPSKTTPQPELIVGFNRVDWEGYRPKETESETKKDLLPVEHRRRHDFPGQSRFIIDVVVSESWSSKVQSKDEEHKRQSSPLDTAEPVVNSKNASTAKEVPQPERIRINSTLLLRALEKITGQACPKSVVNDDIELLSQVFLRPFKLFVIYDQEIRDHLTGLQKALYLRESPQTPHTGKDGDFRTSNENLPNTVRTGPGNDLLEPQSPIAAVRVMDQDSLESGRCLKELLVLVKVFDTILKPTFDLRRCIENGSCREIAFQDLWHLFRLGDVIQSAGAGGYQQTYRIMNVCGGKPFLCNRKEVTGLDPIEGRDVPRFSVLCFFYATDGTDVGAVQKVFTIKWYDGAKAIASLPMYPIGFSRITSETSVRQYFVDRGRRTMQLTQKTDVAQHKTYDGLTLTTGIREEVSFCVMT